MSLNQLMWFGDSQLLGTGSTAALQSAGPRWLVNQAMAAAGKRSLALGAVFGGSFVPNACECYTSTITTILTNSRRMRANQQQEILIVLAGTNDLNGAGTVAALAAAYTAALTEIFDAGAHAIPPGGTQGLKAVLCLTLLRRLDEGGNPGIGAKVIDFNTNRLPGIVAAQKALSRNVILVDAFTAVTSIGGDQVHPDDVGHTQLANVILPFVLAQSRAAV